MVGSLSQNTQVKKKESVTNHDNIKPKPLLDDLEQTESTGSSSLPQDGQYVQMTPGLDMTGHDDEEDLMLQEIDLS